MFIQQSNVKHFPFTILCLKMIFLKHLCIKYNRLHRIFRKFSTNKQRNLILGIETSCDDTGCAIVDNHGNILGEALNSQEKVHLK